MIKGWQFRLFAHEAPAKGPGHNQLIGTPPLNHKYGWGQRVFTYHLVSFENLAGFHVREFCKNSVYC